jgi:dihydropteroate synthase
MLLPSGEIVDLHQSHQVMGILNVTPDSFSDGGDYQPIELAHRHAEKMVADGADWIDIGGESTRPGADPISTETEINRVLPVIQSIRSIPGIRISIDTRNSDTAKAALQEGALLINDVSGGMHDPEMLSLIAHSQSPCCLMHMRGTPATMKLLAAYDDVVFDVKRDLLKRVTEALAKGVQPEQIIIDPGIGFAKTPEQSMQLIARLSELTSLGFPILVGASRKRLLTLVTDAPPKDRLGGSIALALAAIRNGASIVRVHDVAATVQALKTQEIVARFAQS